MNVTFRPFWVRWSHQNIVFGMFWCNPDRSLSIIHEYEINCSRTQWTLIRTAPSALWFIRSEIFFVFFCFRFYTYRLRWQVQSTIAPHHSMRFSTIDGIQSLGKMNILFTGKNNCFTWKNKEVGSSLDQGWVVSTTEHIDRIPSMIPDFDANFQSSTAS